MIYIIKRPVKSRGRFYPVGTVVKDDGSIKRFKQKITEGKIVAAPKDSIESWEQYFKLKFNTPLIELNTNTKEEEKEPSKEEIEAHEENKKDSLHDVIVETLKGVTTEEMLEAVVTRITEVKEQLTEEELEVLADLVVAKQEELAVEE